MSITLPPETMSKANQQAKEAGFADASSYLIALIDERDEGLDELDDAELEAALVIARRDQAAGRIQTLDEAFEGIYRKHGFPRKPS